MSWVDSSDQELDEILAEGEDMVMSQTNEDLRLSAELLSSLGFTDDEKVVLKQLVGQLLNQPGWAIILPAMAAVPVMREVKRRRVVEAAKLNGF